jgi:hypothetical protein
MEDNLRILKLNTSETVVVKILNETTSGLVSKHPLRAVILPAKEGGMSLAMMRWEIVFDFDDEVVFNKMSVVAIAQPSKEISQAYLDAIAKYKEPVEKDDEEIMKDLADLMKLSRKDKILH